MQYNFRSDKTSRARKRLTRSVRAWGVFLAATALTGCATTNGGALDTGTTTAYIYRGDDELLTAHAPVFVIEHDEKPYNKIGTPSARYSSSNREEIFVDPSIPTIFHQIRTFQTEKGVYTNLIYRVHFERSPFTWAPFNASAGKNVGVIAVVTLDEDKQPVLLTTVQSCGCYHAITPSNFLEPTAYPEKWNTDGVTVYGEHLPGRLDFPAPFSHDSKIAITIRDGSHRTSDIRVAQIDQLSNIANTQYTRVAPVEALKTIPLGDTSVSFYHENGRKKGLVKGAYKPWETLLFGLWAWDSHVGQDREYASKEESGHRFYTTLTASKKKRSDMWNYEGYLNHNGWKP